MIKISHEPWYIINFYYAPEIPIEITSDKKIVATRVVEVLGTLSEDSKRILRDFIEKDSPLTGVLSFYDNLPFTGLRLGIVHIYPAKCIL